MCLSIDYQVKCPQCDSDSIFTLIDSPTRRLPVRASRECRCCKHRFFTKFDKYTGDVKALAEATVFKSVEGDVWTGVFVEGVFDTWEDAVQAQISELVKEYED